MINSDREGQLMISARVIILLNLTEKLYVSQVMPVFMYELAN